MANPTNPCHPEITISYVERDLNVSSRRSQLQRSFFFACRCRRCTEELRAEEEAATDGATAGTRPLKRVRTRESATLALVEEGVKLYSQVS